MLFNTTIKAITIPTLGIQHHVENSEWKDDGSFFANNYRIRIYQDTMWIYTKDSYNEFRISSMKYDFQMQVLTLDGYLCDNPDPVEIAEEEVNIFSKVPEETFYLLLEAAKQRDEKGVVAWGRDLVSLKDYITEEEYNIFCTQFVEDYYRDDDGGSILELANCIAGRLEEEIRLSEAAEQEYQEIQQQIAEEEMLHDFIDISNQELNEERTNLSAMVISIVNFFVHNHAELKRECPVSWDNLVNKLLRKVRGHNAELCSLVNGLRLN